MKQTVNNNLNSLIDIVHTLSFDDKMILMQSLEKEIIQTKNPKKKLSDILKTGPVMNAEGYGNYKHLKKDFDKWLKKLL